MSFAGLSPNGDGFLDIPDSLPHDIMDVDPNSANPYQYPGDIDYNLAHLLPQAIADVTEEVNSETEAASPIDHMPHNHTMSADQFPAIVPPDSTENTTIPGTDSAEVVEDSYHAEEVQDSKANDPLVSEEVMDVDEEVLSVGSLGPERVLPDGSILVLDKAVPTTSFEIVLSNPAINPDEYEELMPDIAEAIIGTAMDETGEQYFEIQYADGHRSMIICDEIFGIENGPEVLETYEQLYPNKTTSKKRRRLEDSSPSEQSSSGRQRKRPDIDSPDELEDDTLIGNYRQTSIRRYTQPIPRNSRQPSESSYASSDNRALSARHARSDRASIRELIEEDYSSIDYEDKPDHADTSKRAPIRKAAVYAASAAAAHAASFMSSDDEEDDDFFIVRSDIAPDIKTQQQQRGRRRNKRRVTAARSQLLESHQRRSGSRESSIEFEEDTSRRRPQRAARPQKSYRENDAMDPESFYILDDKLVQPPKAISVKELFKEIPYENLFAQVHMHVCDACNMSTGNGRGILVHCQGCSLSYHRMCIGPRYAREHIATKVGEGDFVLQCRFCLAKHAQKDPYAPRLDKCQSCREPGISCAPFSQKKTPKQEEKLREENDGVDPITLVKKELVNNHENVLFRCIKCRRGWHINHLPPLSSSSSDIASELFREYSKNWKCSDCSTQKLKIDTVVAWRLESDAVTRTEAFPPAQKRARAATADDVAIMDFSEYTDDEKQYLIKWAHQSHNHVTWMPGAWVYSVTAGSSRKSFAKKAMSLDMYKKTTEEAVPDEYLLMDVIFNVKYHPDAQPAKTYEDDLERLADIIKVYFKPQGLAYVDSVWDALPDETRPDVYHSFVLAYQQYLAGKYFVQEPNIRMRERIAEFKKTPFEDVVLASQPPELKGKLMDYQLNGVNWMLRRYHNGSNAILADEMGLGKTVQVITLLTTLIKNGPRVWPFLVVVPNSTCPNWRREIKQWSPQLRVVTYYGGKEAQTMAYDFELFPTGSASDMKAHIVVMSYDSAQDEETRKKFRHIHWAGLVVDEGQRLKNDKNLLYAALSSMRFPFRLLLTGTPLQNNKRELFNLLQFVDKKYDAEALDEEFRDLTSEKIHELHQLINPYFYRRTKAGVLKFLPPMSQIIVPVSMTVVQEKLCKSIIAKNPQLIQTIFRNTKIKTKTKERGSLNNILMQLRKCLCHPFLYSDAIEERNDDPVISHRNLVEASGKLILLEALLTRLKEQGHRVLIFSQFLGQLDILEDFLNGMGVESARLDGSIRSLERQKRIDRFNEPDSTHFAFLLTTRAGGVGINLATADTVIILDPDFNPHQDLQALSRAHRIGQREKVLCLQLMTKDSVEEKIMQMGKKKMALDHALIERMGASAEAGNDLEDILKHGAEALFQDDDRERIRYDAAAIEKLLDRSFTKADQETNPEAEFTYGKVWSNDDGGTVKDSFGTTCEEAKEAATSSVWESILAQREKEAAQELEAKKEILGRGGRTRRAVNYRTNKHGDFLKDSDQSEEEADLDSKSLDGSGDEKDDEPEDEAMEYGEVDLDFMSPKEKRPKSRGLANKTKSGSTPSSTPSRNVTPVPPPVVLETKKNPRARKSKSQAPATSNTPTLMVSAVPVPATAMMSLAPPTGQVQNFAAPQMSLPLHQPPPSQPQSVLQYLHAQAIPNRARILPIPVMTSQMQLHMSHPPILPPSHMLTSNQGAPNHLQGPWAEGMQNTQYLAHHSHTIPVPIMPNMQHGQVMSQQQQQQQQYQYQQIVLQRELELQQQREIKQSQQLQQEQWQREQEHTHFLESQRLQARFKQLNEAHSQQEAGNTHRQTPAATPEHQCQPATISTPARASSSTTAPSPSRTSPAANQIRELRMLLPGIFKVKGLKVQVPPPESHELQKAVVPTVAMIRVAMDSLNRLGLPAKIHQKSVHFLDNLLQQAKEAQRQGKTITVYPRGPVDGGL